MRLLVAAAIAVTVLRVFMPMSGASVEGDRRLLKSASGYQTVSMLDGGSTGLYYDYGSLVGELRPYAKRVVLLGMGGGEMLRAARRTLPDAELVGVELSPWVAVAARNDFKVEEFGVRIVVEDAATFIDKQKPGSIDGLMVDVYDDAALPAYFQSPVFFRACRKALSPKGLLMMNVYPADLGPKVSEAMGMAGFGRVQFFVSGPNLVVVAER